MLRPDTRTKTARDKTGSQVVKYIVKDWAHIGVIFKIFNNMYSNDPKVSE